MGLPLVLAAVSLGSQVAKGIGKRKLAKKREGMAKSMLNEGRATEAAAWQNRKDFALSDRLNESLNNQEALLSNQITGESPAAQAMRDQANLSLSASLPQFKRVSSTTNQALSGVLAAEKMRQNMFAQAAIKGQEDRTQAMGMLSGLSAQRANLENLQYKYNVIDPFNIRYARSIEFQNQGLAGKIASENMKLAGFGDTMNALSSASSSILDAVGGIESDSWIQKLGKGGMSKAPTTQNGLDADQLRMRQELYGY